jgi:dTDP-4-amino-4,6-dideoxygalactose transaminase
MWLPHTGPEVIQAATRALEIGYLGLGKATKRFEEELSRTSSWTTSAC